jgi:hypothetical protein
MAELFSFPNPVNEVSARLVAGGVVVMAVLTIALDQPWIIAVLAYGFVARVLTGPTLSPLGQLVTRVITPALPFEAKWVAGPPKRFAQGIGAVFTVSAAIAYFGFDEKTVAYVLVGFIIIAATLESVFAICLGCKVFAVLMRFGVIPDEVCERCNNVWGTSPGAATPTSEEQLT